MLGDSNNNNNNNNNTSTENGVDFCLQSFSSAQFDFSGYFILLQKVDE